MNNGFYVKNFGCLEKRYITPIHYYDLITTFPTRSHYNTQLLKKFRVMNNLVTDYSTTLMLNQMGIEKKQMNGYMEEKSIC